MISVSAAFKEAMQWRRDFKLTASVFPYSVSAGDPASYVFDYTKISIKGNSYTTGAESQGLPLGQAIGKVVQVDLLDEDGVLDSSKLPKGEIFITCSIELDDGAFESFTVDGFTITKATKKGNTLTIEGADKIYEANEKYRCNLDFTQEVTADMLLDDVLDQVGTTLSDNSAHPGEIPVMKPPEGMTCREILGYLAMLVGGNAYHFGLHLHIVPYDFDYTDEATMHNFDCFKSLEVADSDILISAIKTNKIITVDGETVSTELMSGVDDEKSFVISYQNPLIDGLEDDAVANVVFNTIVSKLKLRTFRPFRGEHVAYPLANFMDKVKVTDAIGNSYYSVLTNITFNWGGTTEFANEVEESAPQDIGYDGITNYTDETISADKVQGGVAKMDGLEIQASNGIVFQTPIVQWGGMTSFSCAANSVTVKTITFEREFPSAAFPVVTMVAGSGSVSTVSNLTFTIMNATKTGFDLRVYNSGSSATSPAFRWIAVCAP